jgi:hypothetical protein
VVARPVGERGAALPGGALGPRRVVPGDDLDPQHPVREVDRVEGELEARAAARPREIRVHARTRPSSFLPPRQSTTRLALLYLTSDPEMLRA